MVFTSGLVIVSEAALALYPILIKTVPVNLSSQLVSRFLTFTVLGLIFSGLPTLLKLYSPGAIGRTLGLGGITLAHVFSSYYAFEKLPAGIAMSLFYTYPIMNLLGGYLGYGETITIVQTLLVGVAIAGVIFLAQGTREEESGATEKKEIAWAGVLAGLAAAFTETLMYFAVRTAHVVDPYYSTVELYSGALLGMLGLMLAGKLGGLGSTAASALRFEDGAYNWIKMTVFNSIIGFAGYALRFYAIPKMSTLAFSMLSLVGVIASFVWGLLFVNEVPNMASIIGAAMITVAAAFTDRK